MKNSGRPAAFIAALVFVCGIVGWLWYSHVGAPQTGAPAPVQAITAAPSPTGATAPSATQRPVVFVPQQTPSTAAPAPAGRTAPSPQPQRSGAPSAAATQTPIEASAAPAAQATPVPLVTLAPSAALPGVVREPAEAPPRILALSLSTPVAHGGEVVSGYVEASSNVASVEARIAGYSMTMRKIGVGKFVMSYRVPHLPFFLHKTYAIQVIARNTRGDAVSSSVPITIR